MGDSSPVSKSLGFCLDWSIARIRGLEKSFLCFDPGACAPGFMLPPASQAKTALLVQSHLDTWTGFALKAIQSAERRRRAI